jgi:cyclase
MAAKRIIPCLDVKDARVVKGINFKGLRDMGHPAEMGVRYGQAGADELVFLDIVASEEGRTTREAWVQEVAATLSIPFTVGGGVSSVDGIRRLLRAGADKVALNTAAIADPALITQAAAVFGRQCVVVAVDVAWKTGARARSCSPPSTGTAPSRALIWSSWTSPPASPSR